MVVLRDHDRRCLAGHLVQRLGLDGARVLGRGEDAGVLAAQTSRNWVREIRDSVIGSLKRDHGVDFDQLDKPKQAALNARLKDEMRRNTYDAARGAIVLSADRAAAVRSVARHYTDLFGDARALDAGAPG